MKSTFGVFYTMIIMISFTLIAVFLFFVKNGQTSIFTKNEGTTFLSLYEKEINSTSTKTVLLMEQIDEEQILVRLDQNTKPLNVGEVEIFFNPDHFLVKELIIDEALCEKRFLIKKIIDNDEGRIFYQCGTVSPTSFSSLVLSKLVIFPKIMATSSVSFGLNTNLYVHDGLGTKVDVAHFNLEYSNY